MENKEMREIQELANLSKQSGLQVIFLHVVRYFKKRIMMLRATLSGNKGIGTIEIILILVVLIALVVIFKNELTELVNSVFQRITNDASGL